MVHKLYISLYHYKEHWPNFVVVIEMAINFTINASIQKEPCEVLYDENTPLLIDLSLSREFPSTFTHTSSLER